ncbi:endonuclease III [Candidatus Coxiella mudrowiae]|uniref:Endonuclease III n=1 Tax=Candidatus Coxiella mudrowiae TaxID=2054173 RepID=A0ABN4HNP4_9COXI|nr:endonuclease III [Candidatus Coxiella mudrowiae]AKQ33245.1 Endonuclease III [Candidatus Coxiella mudrowiae]
MNQSEREEIFRRFKARNAKPTSELIYLSEFELLIAVMLSAQATDVSVNKSTKELFKVANTPLKMLNLGEEGLKNHIKSIGLYNTKAKNIIKTCKILVEKYHSQIPQTREEFEALPGVGRKTANVILNTAFGHSAIAVDTHIFRLANRTGLAPGKTPLAVENKLMEVVPKKYLVDAHHWLVLHGRYICTARHPKCPECFINDLCEYPQNDLLK